jgi:hypothetical protein
VAEQEREFVRVESSCKDTLCWTNCAEPDPKWTRAGGSNCNSIVELVGGTKKGPVERKGRVESVGGS